ncbi:hypothetical protein C7N43_31520 [Sphingobacteriales bacterium UPWRP_1]|nr:hypothetical protein B6N25_15440 [Sphingobacteriales bacterium TSM_CSS]PSJ72953.1 hypothetical protein C7N43_31520 [Sphingobacteriales bacterium UPWRP_1]
MNLNKILLAGLAGGVVSFFLGWIIYGMLLRGAFEPQYTTPIMRPDNEMVFWALILGNLSCGMLYSYIFGRWAGISNWMTGAQAGAVIGLLIGMYYDFTMYATANVMTLQGTLMDLVVCVVMGAAVGAVVAFVLGMGGKK